MVVPTDEPQAAPAPPDPRADAPEIHGDTGKPSAVAKKPAPSPSRIPSIIVGVVIAAVGGLSIWYLVRPQPLLVQGEADATRYDNAARVEGRVSEVPVERGQNVAAGAVLVRIDNPETIAQNQQELAARIVAEAQLANVNVGTRPEVIAQRKAELERAEASVVLAQKTYDPSASWPGTATLRSLSSTKPPILCMRVNRPSIRPNRPSIRRSTVTPKRSTRSLRRMLAKPSPTSRPCNRSSTRW